VGFDILTLKYKYKIKCLKITVIKAMTMKIGIKKGLVRPYVD